VTTNFPENTENLLIAPLLLLPLVENCFKHGTSRMIDQPWINIYSEIKGNKLCIKLLNSKPHKSLSSNHNTGIGLSSIRKSLELIYPNKFDLKVIQEDDLFAVILKLELQTISSSKSYEQII
jgi:LytS/YehU family sensor histidine kinase